MVTRLKISTFLIFVIMLILSCNYDDYILHLKNIPSTPPDFIEDFEYYDISALTENGWMFLDIYFAPYSSSLLSLNTEIPYSNSKALQFSADYPTGLLILKLISPSFKYLEGYFYDHMNPAPNANYFGIVVTNGNGDYYIILLGIFDTEFPDQYILANGITNVLYEMGPRSKGYHKIGIEFSSNSNEFIFKIDNKNTQSIDISSTTIFGMGFASGLEVEMERNNDDDIIIDVPSTEFVVDYIRVWE